MMAIAQNRFDGRVRFEHAAFDVDDQHCIESRLNERVCPRFDALELFAAAEGFGDVPENTLNAHDLSLRIAKRRLADLHVRD